MIEFVTVSGAAFIIKCSDDFLTVELFETMSSSTLTAEYSLL
ncbi:hypothetical protein A2U01_0016667 [Trifolium medium]|uniref:Uncharacterized protein n=1 Tax=Trifolium medium TaxID=97028 RepID=A0A392N7B9_9FABA|nr:hypothetical protein [Trifolium medium]